jgi:hypothetical protein
LYTWREEGSPDTELADPDAADIASSSPDSDADSSSSDSTSDTDSDNSSISKRNRATGATNKITNESHALLSAEIDKLESTSSSRPTTVTIPAPLSDIDSDGDADDDERGGASQKKQADGGSASVFATKNELENPPVPMVELEELEPHERIEPIGSIMSLVGSAVIVQTISHGSHRILDTGSLLAFEDRKVFGAVSLPLFLMLKFTTHSPFTRFSRTPGFRGIWPSDEADVYRSLSLSFRPRGQ